MPDKFTEIMKFTFDEKIISYKILKDKFPNLTDETLDEFLNAMKNMMVFI